MLPELNFRYRLYQKLMNSCDKVARGILRIESKSPHKNLRVEYEGSIAKSVVYKSKNKSFRVFHRASAADLGVIEQILINEDYSLNKFKQSSWVNEAYDKIKNSGLKPTVIDAGANIGLASLYLAEIFDEAQIIAVEPSSENINYLKKNTEALNCRIVHGAINSDNSTLELYDGDKGEWGFSTHNDQSEGSKTVETVKCHKFRDLLKGDEYPFILKVDIEGGEKNEFSDHEFLSKFALIVIELHDWLYPKEKTSQSFIDFTAKTNFDFCHSGENIFLFNRDFNVIPR